MVYYGLSLNSSQLVSGDNDYVTFAVSGAVEIPAYVAVLLALSGLGRRRPLCAAMIVAGGALLCLMAIPEGKWHHW